MPMWASQISASCTARSASARNSRHAEDERAHGRVEHVVRGRARSRPSQVAQEGDIGSEREHEEQDEAEVLPHVEDERARRERGAFRSEEDQWHGSDILAWRTRARSERTCPST
jgi:hypothetical protein